MRPQLVWALLWALLQSILTVHNLATHILSRYRALEDEFATETACTDESTLLLLSEAGTKETETAGALQNLPTCNRTRGA